MPERTCTLILMDPKLTGLWRHPNFLKLWGGETISLLGSRISSVALPLTAALTLHASPLQMGLLGMVSVPSVLLGPFLGVWVDRSRRRPLLIGVSLGRVLILATVPVAALVHLLTLAQLYVVFALHDILSNASGAAYRPFLSMLLTPDELVEGNSKMEVSSAVATIVGPGLAGIVVQVLTGPFAIALDAASYLVTSLTLALIRIPTDTPARPSDHSGVLADVGEMLGTIRGSPILRAMAGTGSALLLFQGFGLATYVLYLTRDLRLAPREVGLLYTVGGAGALAGALLAGRLTERLGVGPAIVASLLLTSISSLLVPLAGSSPFTASLVVILFLATAQFLQGASLTVYYINWYSLSQVVVPHYLLGRFTATMGTLVFSAQPMGALVAGALSSLISLKATLLAATIILCLMSLRLLRSPLQRVRELTDSEMREVPL